jgi:FlaA1/EpsC-like NDP-sugar epimerase
MHVNKLFSQRYFRSALLMGLYLLISLFSYYFAYELRFDFAVPESFAAERSNSAWWILGLKLALLYSWGQVGCILSYFRLPDVIRLFLGLLLNACILVLMWYIYDGQGVPPRSVILSDLLMSFFLIGSFRVFMRVQSSRSLEDWFAADRAENVLLVGAGEVGAGLCSELMHKSGLGMRPVAFLDDDPNKIGRDVHGIPVVDSVEHLARVAKRYSVSKVIIAFPSASIKRIHQVIKLSREAGLPVERVPALTDLVSGQAEISQLRPIELEDLLGRDPVDLNSEKIRAMLQGKRVLITGAGGSIGRELVAQILSYQPAALHCLDQAEIAIFNLLQDVLEEDGDLPCEVFTSVLDVAGGAAMEALFQQFKPEVVFHAAAHKHVNLMEAQPAEALKNNFFATIDLVELASRSQVERFIFISTDKAINPTSVMGASKRLAELALQAQQAQLGNHTQFMSVRFGNVLGSSGSVIPIFRRQIAAGGPITVTDPAVTRFFMTIEEAVGLVLESATQGSGGEIFVLDMGESVKIIDLARQMLSLSGLREGVDIDIKFIGLRPGEKLFEEVQHLNESLSSTAHPRVLRLVAQSAGVRSIAEMQSVLQGSIAARDAATIKRAIQALVPEYTPYFES